MYEKIKIKAKILQNIEYLFVSVFCNVYNGIFQNESKRLKRKNCFDEIKKKYNSIIKDFLKIRSEKLNLKNIEDNKSYYYSNSNYNLPWDSFKEFKSDDFINIAWDDGLNENKHDIKYKITELKKVDIDEISLYPNRKTPPVY